MLQEELIARRGLASPAENDAEERAGSLEYDSSRTDDQLIVLYRALRKAREDAKDEPGAGDFYVGEMEARRRGSRRFAERLVLTAYNALSGYGQRAGRALAWLALLVAVLTGLLVATGLPDTSGPAQQVTGTISPGRTGAPPQVQLEVTTLRPDFLPTESRPARIERVVRIAVGSVLFRDADQQLTPQVGRPSTPDVCSDRC